MHGELRKQEAVTRAILDYVDRVEPDLQAYEDVFERMIEKRGHNPYSRPRNDAEKEVFDLLEHGLDYVHNWEDELYRVKVEKEDLRIAEQRLGQILSHGYDDMELIGMLQVEAERLGKTPSARDARNSEFMPSEIPYINRYDEWCNAKWRAGLDSHEKLGRELLLEKLVDEIHRFNEEEIDIADYSIPTGPQLDESSTAPSERALRNEFGSYDVALEEAGFHLLREEGSIDRWVEEELEPVLDSIPAHKALAISILS